MNIPTIQEAATAHTLQPLPQLTRPLHILVAGATGLVGRTLLALLREHPLGPTAPEDIVAGQPHVRITVAASDASVGKHLDFGNHRLDLVSMEDALAFAPDIALFSAGGEASRAWAPRFAAAGTVVIDNSSAWRMADDVPLLIPEINGAEYVGQKLVANPNCSTIQMLMALAPLHQAFGLRTIRVATYQSVSGSGQGGIDALAHEEHLARTAISHLPAPASPYAHPIHRNAIPACDAFEMDQDAYTREELKMRNESRKIMALPHLLVAATCVRVPTTGGHGEAIWASFDRTPTVAEAQQLLANAPGVQLMDDPHNHHYPTPLQAHHRDAVLVGRLRPDHADPNGLSLWVVADNLRKGAATNAVQLAHHVARHHGWML